MIRNARSLSIVNYVKMPESDRVVPAVMLCAARGSSFTILHPLQSNRIDSVVSELFTQRNLITVQDAIASRCALALFADGA